MDEEVEDAARRALERIAATELAEQAAIKGDPICGALFGFLHLIRKDPYGAFLDDFYPWGDDDDADIRPY